MRAFFKKFIFFKKKVLNTRDSLLRLKSDLLKTKCVYVRIVNFFGFQWGGNQSGRARCNGNRATGDVQCIYAFYTNCFRY